VGTVFASTALLVRIQDSSYLAQQVRRVSKQFAADRVKFELFNDLCLDLTFDRHRTKVDHTKQRPDWAASSQLREPSLDIARNADLQSCPGFNTVGSSSLVSINTSYFSSLLKPK
jgi:hypothetical protein